VQPVVTVAEMVAFDEDELTRTSHEDLVARAGEAVFDTVNRLFGDPADRTVVVIAGKGSNGADGRVAASLLEAAGAVVTVVGPEARPEDLVGADLVIDAAFGTGLTRPYAAPRPPDDTIVMAVDLPSGLDGDTGECFSDPMIADVTVTMAAPKVGLFFGSGPEFSGHLVVADIGISTLSASMALVEDSDLELIPRRARDDHKWTAAVVVVAGSPGMEGAATLATLGAMRAGSGMVRLVTPRPPSAPSASWPLEAVRLETELPLLAEIAAAEAVRARSIVLGPGLGRSAMARAAVRELVATRRIPMVLDADGLDAIENVAELRSLVAESPAPVVVTPHEGELRRLLGVESIDDRLATVRALARDTGATVLLKGPTTIVASPSDEAPSTLLVSAGTPALATAGTGDVLAGVIGALLARGLDPLVAAALGAHLHGRAGARSRGTLIASDLPALIGEVLEEVGHGS